MKRWVYYALGVAGGLLLLWLWVYPVVKSALEPPFGQTAEGHLRAERYQLTRPELLVELINPASGKVIVDIGAGFGMFTFQFAERVGPEGIVFSTDIDSDALAYLKKRSERDGLVQIRPVAVRTDRLDAFYKKQKFDIAFVSDALLFLPSLKDFFGDLRETIAPGGRLWISDTVLDPDFRAEEMPDAANLRQRLQSGPAKTALLDPLPETTRQMLLNEPGPGQPDPLIPAIVEVLNQRLNDAELPQQAEAARWPLSDRETDVRYALGRISQDTRCNPAQQRVAMRLRNRMILQDLLQMDLWERAFALDTTSFRDWEVLLHWIATAPDLKELFANAGYELVKQHDVLPYHTVFEFKVRGG